MVADGLARPVELQKVIAAVGRFHDRREHPVIGAIDGLAPREGTGRGVLVGAGDVDDRHLAAGQLHLLRGRLVLGVAAVGLTELAIPPIDVGLHAATGAHHRHPPRLLPFTGRGNGELRLHDRRLGLDPLPSLGRRERIAAVGDREDTGLGVGLPGTDDPGRRHDDGEGEKGEEGAADVHDSVSGTDGER